MKNISKKQLLLTSLLTSAVIGMSAMPAHAQSDDEYEYDEVVVTGSLIPKSGNLTGTSPVTEVSAEEFTQRGVIQVEDMINTLPQAFGAQGSNLANGATGTSSLNLRGLGATRNLVLLNGRRLPYGSLNTASVDVNFIPSVLVKSVDILTGGASAAYGSDAISGVANFIIDDKFEGFKLDVNYSFYQHNNNNSEIQSLLGEFAAGNPSQYSVPDGSVSDGESFDITGVAGGEFTINDSVGHITAYAGYQKTKPILQDARDYSQCALSTRNAGAEFTCAGSSTNQIANLLELDPGYSFDASIGSVWARVDPANGDIIARDFTTDTFNYNPYNHYQRPNSRYSLGAFVDYEIAPGVEFFSELMFMENSTNSQIAPSGVFGLGIQGDAGGINCNNAFFSAAQFNAICGQAGLTTADVAPILILRRNVEGGLRNNDITHTTFRGLAGIKGDLAGTPLSYNLTGSFARVRRSEIYNNDLSKSKIANALNAVANPTPGGAPVCAINVDADPTNDDPNCVPYDIWSAAGPSDAAVAYIANPLLRTGTTEQTVVTGTLFGPIDGAKLGSAVDSPAFAAGIEYRRDSLNSQPDANFISGDGAGQGGPTNPISGSQDVWDVFAELNVPLIQERRGIEQLGVDLAYRRSHYDKVNSDAYKIGVDYAPSNDIRFRGTYQRAVRAANIFELFSTQSIGLFDLAQGSNGLYDPCSGTTPSATAAQCANTGVTPGQYGNIADNPAGQFNNFTGGNPDLLPEKSDTFTIGFVATPSMLPGLTLSLDYFDIKVDGFIDTVPEQLALDQCLNTGDSFFCGLINRGSGGTLWANQTGFITATNINTGTLSTSGFDLLAGYEFDVSSFLDGTFDLSYVGTLLGDLTTQPLPSSGADQTYDCVGYYGGNCGQPTPEYRHKVSLDFLPVSDKYSAQLTWRYYGSVDVAGSSSQAALSGSFSEINKTLGSQNYFDLSGTYAVKDYARIRLGVNNIFDREPPLSSIVGTAPGNGNTYPQVYDAFGRYVFMGATLEF